MPNCTPAAPKTLLGMRTRLTTDANGVGAFAIDGLTNVTPGTLVVATVDSLGDSSDISNCVVADRNNTSWPTAFAARPDEQRQYRLPALGR